MGSTDIFEMAETENSVIKENKFLTIMSSLSPDGKHFDLFYEDVELVEESEI